MPIIDEYYDILNDKRHGANRGFHTALVNRVRKHLGTAAATELENSFSSDARDFNFLTAVRRARAALKNIAPDEKLTPFPKPPINLDTWVWAKTWTMFQRCALRLTDAFSADKVLLFITVTCRADEARSWNARFRTAQKRRDDVITGTKDHAIWSASFFDVQAVDDNPHWHILLISDMGRIESINSVLARSVSMKVRYCDFENPKDPSDLRDMPDRARSWLRTLTYCTKVAAPVRLDLDREWLPLLREISREESFVARTQTEATHIKAVFEMRYRRGGLVRPRKRGIKFYTAGEKLKPLEAVLAQASGRPGAVLDPDILDQVRAGTMTRVRAAGLLGVTRQTIARHL